MRSSLLTLAASAATALAQIKGFNYASQGQTQQTFEDQFNVAKGLVGTSGWSSARLYTMIQEGTANTVISAIPAAINTKTTLLLGLWASENQDSFNNELTALSNALNQYGSAFADLVVGISVGSEDLYRDSVTGQQAKAGYGVGPDVVVDYIGQVRKAVAGTLLSKAPIIHVDTWNAWTNSSNSAVIQAVDAIGMDTYPYYQSTYENSIENAGNLFFEAYDATVAVAQGKPVWVTESGWPTSGPNQNLAVASVENAASYWQQVACKLEGVDNVWWYILVDAGASPSFGVTGSLSTTPLYDLSCKNSASSSSSSAAPSSTEAPSSTAAAATTPTSAATTGVVSISNPIPQGDYVTGGATAGSSSLYVPSAGSSGTAAVSDGAAPAVTAMSTVTGDDGIETIYVKSTTLLTITGCNVDIVSNCACTAPPTAAPTASGMTTVATSDSAAAAMSSSQSAILASANTANAASTMVPTGAPAASGCPADLNGAYQYPHLIVPVNSSSPDTAYGTQYNATISPKVSTIFNFDIPASYAGKECSTIFLFPELDQLETSSYSWNGKGGIVVRLLSGEATEQTTYANAPKALMEIGKVDKLKSGKSYTISHDSCPAGKRSTFEISSTGGLELNFFEDYNPSPLGYYVRAC